MFSTLGTVVEALNPTIKMRVYADGSVVVEFEYFDRIEDIGVIEAFIQCDLEAGDNYYELMAKLGVITPYSCQSDSCMYMEMIMNITGMRINELYETNIRLFLNIWDNRGNALNLSLDPLNYKLNINSLRGVLTGTVELSATGEGTQIIESVSTLDKQVIEQFLGMAGITWVTVKTFTVEIEDSRKARLVFELEVDESEFAGILGVNIESLREQYRTFPSMTGNVYYHINATGFYMEISLRVNKNINEHLNQLVNNVYNVILIQSALSRISTLLSPTGMGIPTASTEPMLTMFTISRKFSENFNILSSRGSLVIELKENTLTVNLVTPRLIKKDAKTPTDTLLALYNLAVDMQNELGMLGIEELLDIPVTLIPESGVKITRDGVEVQQVTLRELTELEVITPTPTPTKPTLAEQIPLIYLVAAAVVVIAALTVFLVKKK